MNKFLELLLISVAGMFIFALTLFLSWGLGFVDFPYKTTTEANIKRIDKGTYWYYDFAITGEETGAESKLCIAPGIEVPLGRYKITYGRGWFLPMWRCPLFTDELIWVEGK